MRILVMRLVLFFRNLSYLGAASSMLFWAGLTGLIGALATICFRDGLAGMQWLLIGHSGSFVEMAATLPWQIRVVLPCAGGLVAGFFLFIAQRTAPGSPVDYMDAIAVGDGQVPVRQTLLRSLSSLCTIASGGSVGREGSMIQLAAMCASVAGRAVHFEPHRMRLLVACGAAAGITSAYNAPIASAFFVAEIVLGSFAMDSLGPIMIASVVANITMRDFPGYKPTYEMPEFPDVPNLEVALFVVLGIVAGLAAPQFLRLLGVARDMFQKSALPKPVQLSVGGLIVGILSIWVPQVWGNGYSVVNSLLHAQWLWSAVLIVLAFKIVATLATAGSGAVGGIFTPTLFVGAAIGHLFGQAIHGIWPGITSVPSAYAIVGMGAFLAATTGAPVMAILMIFEMTLSYHIMLPLMLSCVIAYFIAHSAGGPSMYEIMIRRNLDAQARLRLRDTQMRELVEPADTVLWLDARFDTIMEMFRQHPVKYIYIVDNNQVFQGVVALRDVTSGPMNEHARETKHAKDFLLRDFLPLITPEMALGDAVQQFSRHHGERLPVVKSIEEPILLGVVFKTALLDAYVRLNRSVFARAEN